MGQLIFLLLLAFAIICAMYGIAEGVRIIQRGLGRLFGIGRSPAQVAVPESPLVQPSAPEQTQLSSAQRCLEELKDLHILRQKGALSESEFEQLKHHILATMVNAKQGSA